MNSLLTAIFVGMATRSHRELIVWQKSVDLVEAIYKLSKSFPREETYGLTSQLRRAAVSVPANIAEGNARASTKDYARFISISRASLMETETLLIIAKRLEYITAETAELPLSSIDEVSRMLYALRNKLVGS